MSKKVKLPNTIFVRQEHDGKGNYLVAFKGGCMEACIDDGPTEVGIYQLQKIYPKVVKTVYLDSASAIHIVQKGSI